MPASLIITGTRKGIGRYLVDHYLERGYRVYGCSRQPFEGPPPPGYRHFEVDVADEAAVHHMVTEVAHQAGGVDALINNAGIASMNHVLLTPLSTLQSIFGTNVFGSFLFARETAKVMVKKKRGRIVNFATVATPLKLEGEAGYAASKAAVQSLTQVMAKELAEFHITVNAVGPTPVKTDLVKNVPERKMKALINTQAIKRFGEPRDVANVCDFFLKPESDFITGQTVFLGGVC